MHRKQPKRLSQASPKTCADECQKTFLAGACQQLLQSQVVIEGEERWGPVLKSTFGVLEVEELELAALLERAREVPKLAVDQGYDGALKQGLGDAPGHGARGGLP